MPERHPGRRRLRPACLPACLTACCSSSLSLSLSLSLCLPARCSLLSLLCDVFVCLRNITTSAASVRVNASEERTMRHLAWVRFSVHPKSPKCHSRRGLFRTWRCTGRMGWMAHRKWKGSEQQPSMLPGPAMPGCCLISFHFL